MVEVHIQDCHPCQMVMLEREPLRMTHLPTEPWKEVAMYVWGPIHTGKYLFAVVCKQSRWVEVEFVTSTSIRAVIPKLDWMFASLGISVSACRNSGLNFNGCEFSNFSKYLGFKHELKMPLNPQANVEQFMRVLKRLYLIARLKRANFKQEVYLFLRAYRATPKVATADLLYPNQAFRTQLLVGAVPCGINFEELYAGDLERKQQMRAYADSKNG